MMTDYSGLVEESTISSMAATVRCSSLLFIEILIDWLRLMLIKYHNLDDILDMQAMQVESFQKVPMCLH